MMMVVLKPSAAEQYEVPIPIYQLNESERRLQLTSQKSIECKKGIPALAKTLSFRHLSDSPRARCLLGHNLISVPT